jgi:uncharacterized membrane protein
MKVMANNSMKKFENVWTASLVLSLLGALDALYLSWVKISHTQVFCGGLGNCERVNTSIYSELFKIPIAYLGFAAYLFLVIVLVLEMRQMVRKDLSVLIIFGTCLIGTLYSLYLTFVEIWVIKAICPYCLVSAIIMILLLALAVVRGKPYLV